MRKIKLFLSLLMVMLVSVGNVWATDFTLSSAAAVTKDGISVSFAKGSGSTAPTWYSAGLRLYASNTITISCDDDITGVTFNWEKQGSKAFASVTASPDSYSHPTAAGEGTWSGSAKSITFTLGSSGQLQLNTFSVTTDGGGSGKENLTDEQLSWSAASANITYGDEPYSLPSLTNSIPVSVTYESTAEAVATISNVGVVSVLKAGSTTIKAVFAGNDDYNAKTVSYTLTVVPAPLTPIAGGIVDEIKISDLLTSGSGYQPFFDKQASNEGHSDAVYAGKVCISSTNIQMNTIGTNTYAGRSIVSTTSGGNAKRVQAFWGGSNTADRKLTVYGSNTAYAGTETAASGTKLGDLTYASGDSYAYIDITGDYAYLQIVASGAIYMSQINITWVAPDVSKVATPEISGTANFYPSTSVSISCSTDDAAIYYTTDGTAPTSASTLYEGAFTVNADGTTTVKAIAVKDGMTDSDVAEQTFTKATVLTVASALSATSGDNVYVTGTITSITEVNVGYKNATYVISDVTAGVPANEMIIYRGKYVNGADFTSEDQIHVGDVVVVSGTIGVYQSKNQLAQGNQIESITPAAVVAPVFSPNGGGFMGETDVTITCETEGSAIYYTLDGTTPTKSSTQYTAAIHLDATTTITAIAFVGEESSLVVAKEFTLTAPMTVAEAYDALTGDDINNAAVAGIVYHVDNISNGHATYWISDNGEAGEKVLEVYNGYGLNGASIAAGGIQVGDEVTVFGDLTIYDKTSTKEFAAGSRLLAFNRPEVAVTGVSLTESTAEVEVDKTVTLHASVVPAKATNKTIVWSVQSGNDKAEVDANGVVTGIAAGEAVIRAASDEDATIFAECTVTVTEPAPLSPFATKFTSNVTLSTEGGTSASDAKVKFYGEETEYDAIKAGTSSVNGAIKVTIPAQATKLHYHAYGWNGEAVTLNITAPTGVTVTPASQAIASNSGIKSNSPFTLAEGSTPQTDAYYAVSLSGNTEEIELTFTATGGKRFVLFGVNQEGALVLESIAISGTASVLEYNDGDHFDPTGLVVTGHYSDDSEATISEGIDWTFDPDPLTEGTTSVSVTATVGEISSDAFVVNGLTVNGAAPLSPWASVYTSNVTLSTEGGTSASAAKVKFYGEEGDGYDAIKAGTGSAQGAVVVNVPAGATALHFHAYGWNSESVGLTVTAPTGVTVSPATEISINSNSGIASNSPFTLAEGSDPKTDAYYAVSLSGNTEATNITISATSGKRFVLFGVNQEGGLVPVLESIEIKGDLITKTGYKAGDALNLAGLTVEATYSIGGVAQTPVDITDKLGDGLTLTYDPLVENQTEVTITAIYGDKSDDITITGLDPVASADPKIYISTLNVNFASVEVGKSVPAAETVIVTLTNVASVTATLGGTNPEAFSISPASLTESGDITISILANTDAAASYAATLTISDGEGGADDKTVNLSFEVTEPVVEDDVTGTWTLVTNATTLAAGKKVIIAQYVEADGAINTMAGQASNNRSVIASTVAGATLTPTVGTKVMTLADAGEGHFYLKTSDGEYLYNASTSSKSYLRTKAEEENVSWTIAVDAEGVATITSVENTNRTKMRYNPNTSGSPLFNCYASGQSDIALYMLEEDAPEPPTPVYETVRGSLTAGNYYTVCYNKTMTAIKGASLWEFEGKDAAFAYIKPATAPYPAGKPYIVYAESEKLEAVLEGDEVTASAIVANGALHGTFELMNQAALDAAGDNIYLIIGNELRQVDGQTGNTLPAYRAYIDLDQIGSAPANMPAHVRSMPLHKDTATGMDELNASETPVKVMINGQMYILRGEKIYDATGRLVK